MDPAVFAALSASQASPAGLLGLPSGWEMIAAQIMGQLSAVSVVQQQQAPEAAEQATLAELRLAIASTTFRLKEIETSLDPITVECARQTIDKLEIAMTKIYKVAVFIRGDYDDREPDKEQRDALLKQAVDAFQDVEDCAELGLKKIADLHSEVVELERAKIMPAKEQIVLMIQKNAETLRSIQDEISSTESTMNNLRNSVNTQSWAVNSLREKISDTRDAKLASDIGFSILTLGIGNLINDGPLDPFNLQRDLDDAQNQLNSAQQQLNEANQRLWQLNSTRSSLGMRNSAQEQLRAQLPELENNAEAAKRNCATIEQRFVELKESSSKLLVKVREIQDGAVVTEALAYSKKEFAAGLLEICLDCLIDRRVFDEAEMVKKEVIEEYGGEIPNEIAEMGVSLDLKLKDLGWTGA